jgi:hypothetical protein
MNTIRDFILCTDMPNFGLSMVLAQWQSSIEQVVEYLLSIA